MSRDVIAAGSQADEADQDDENEGRDSRPGPGLEEEHLRGGPVDGSHAVQA